MMDVFPAVPADAWTDLDSWWADLSTERSVALMPNRVTQLQHRGWTDDWQSIDTFWEQFAAPQAEQLEELRELMMQVRTVWQDGDSQFADDPLSTNWRPESQYEGPLRTDIDEEDWSQWLAHLLRTSAGPFQDELLGLPAKPPTDVRREIVVADEEAIRRVDILIEYKDFAASIEVKNGDENVGKTPETARLVEADDGRDWTHILLVQQSNLARVRQTFDDQLVETDSTRLRIDSDEGPEIEVWTWQSVSRLLRQLLLTGREPDTHWQASAYLFVTLIEQRICNFHSSAFILAATDTDLHRLVAIDPDPQIAYLRALLQDADSHE